MTSLASLVLEKLNLAASLKAVGVLILVVALLWVANVLVHTRDYSSERSHK
jgi:hypothetical protein